MRSPEHTRIERVRRLLAEAGADALLLTHPPNIFYVSGFSGSAGALLVEQSRMTLFTDGRYATQAGQETLGARTRIIRGALLTAVGQFLQRREKAQIGFEPARLSVAEHRELRRAAGTRIRWVALENGVERLRAVKDADEIAQTRQAATVGCSVFLEILPLVRPGMREMEIAAEIDYRMRRKGASGAAFPTIVASGTRAALPHAQPTEKRLRKNELVVLDLGAIVGHYCCDLTRTVFVGRAPARIRRWYRAVQEAQAAARDALRAGVAAGDVDVAARRVLKGFRLEGRFLHSTGHGLGLEVHEEPRLAKGQKKLIQAGNVVTLEPGVYVEGVGGIRIEDDVAIFPEQTEVLTSAPREFLEL